MASSKHPPEQQRHFRGAYMLTFLGIALLIYGSLHLYALGKLWQIVPHTPALAASLIAAGIALTLSPFLVWYLERQSWHSATVISAWISYLWMGYLFLFFCTGLLFDIGLLFSAILKTNWQFTATAQFSSVALLSLAALLYGMVEAQHIRIERITLRTPKQVSGKLITGKLATGKITLAQLSDLHLGIMNGDAFLDRIMAQLNELKPDIVVATGDIVDGQGDNLNELARHFHRYTPPLGAYAVTGNHEYFMGLDSSLNFLRDAGFTVLRGETLRVGGIVLAGVDDHTARAATGQSAKTDISQALASAGNNEFVVLLKHQPLVNADEKFDLQLSGHIHGGQIFPFGYLTRLFYRFNTGLTALADGRKLYVSRGAGTWGPPLRLFAPPEIALITIEHAAVKGND